MVDEHLRTSDPDVYAAGDVASYPDALLGRRRVEHVDHAEKSGEHAGKVMAGADATYDWTVDPNFTFTSTFAATADAFVRGFQEGTARYGLLLDHLEPGFSESFMYIQPVAFGANCGVGASDLLRTVMGFAAAGPERPIIAKGNAGIPRYHEGHIHYDGTPELMAWTP